LADRYRRTATGLALAVRVTPKAGRNAIAGWRAGNGDGDGGPELAVAVTAAPEDGKANAAVAALIAEALGLPKSAVAVAQGGKARHKILRIEGDADSLCARLDAATDKT
jgi:hypothetical protein